jgi:hypothetical protein
MKQKERNHLKRAKRAKGKNYSLRANADFQGKKIFSGK